MNTQRIYTDTGTAPVMLPLGMALQGFIPASSQPQFARKMGWRKCKGCGDKFPKSMLTQKGKAADYVFCSKCVKKWKMKKI